MNKEELIEKIKECETMPELDNLREDTVKIMMSEGQSKYQEVQNIFRKQKNKLLRIPLSDRNW